MFIRHARFIYVSFGITIENKPREFASAFLVCEPPRESFSLGVKSTDVKDDVKVGRKRRRTGYRGRPTRRQHRF